MSTLGGRLKELRQRKGLSQNELAAILHINRATLANWEVDRANPDPEALQKLADFFNVSVDYLLGRTNNPTPDHARKPTLEDEFPEVANVLRRSGKRLTPEDKKRIARIIKAAIEDVDEE